MKGLVYKDIINLKQQAKIYLLILGVWVFVSIAERNMSFFGGVMAVFSVLLPITAYAYDEKVSWDKYALTMPVSRRELVISKYLFGLAMLAVSLVLTVLVGIVVNRGLSECIEICSVFLALGLICMAVTLPAVFRFGTEKARNIMFLFFLVPAAAGMLWEHLDMKAPDPETIRLMTYAAPVAGAALLLLSIPVSIRIYGKKEF